jgi:2-dehydro-3-deoxyphosphogluconate aldolase/(4S)-4-hydroxy-2-oxoglutarate aldolase
MSSTSPHTDRFSRLHEAAIIAVVRAGARDEAVRVAGALLEGGVYAVEITFTTPGAAEALATIRDTYGDSVLLGAGTIRAPAQVEEAVQAGARFLMSAHLRTDVAEAMLATQLPAAPGVFTPSEVAQALDLGAEVVKLFPASTGGVKHLRSLRGPFPDLRVIPTGGIDVDDIAAWFAAGAIAVGVGGELVPRQLLAAGQWEEVTCRAKRFIAAANRAREEKT